MRHRHYAPEGLDTHIVDLESLVARWHSDAAVLCRAATARKLGGRRAALEALPDDPDGYARSLYAALYRLEGSGASTLLIEALPEDEGWSAVRDRIARAAAG
jgi:L-threonylcarbamoyladenylate synthase